MGWNAVKDIGDRYTITRYGDIINIYTKNEGKYWKKRKKDRRNGYEPKQHDGGHLVRGEIYWQKDPGAETAWVILSYFREENHMLTKTTYAVSQCCTKAWGKDGTLMVSYHHSMLCKSLMHQPTISILSNSRLFIMNDWEVQHSGNVPFYQWLH